MQMKRKKRHTLPDGGQRLWRLSLTNAPQVAYPTSLNKAATFFLGLMLADTLRVGLALAAASQAGWASGATVLS